MDKVTGNRALLQMLYNINNYLARIEKLIYSLLAGLVTDQEALKFFMNEITELEKLYPTKRIEIHAEATREQNNNGTVSDDDKQL